MTLLLNIYYYCIKDKQTTIEGKRGKARELHQKWKECVAETEKEA